jgi:hypothetical protein
LNFAIRILAEVRGDVSQTLIFFKEQAKEAEEALWWNDWPAKNAFFVIPVHKKGCEMHHLIILLSMEYEASTPS